MSEAATPKSSLKKKSLSFHPDASARSGDGTHSPMTRSRSPSTSSPSPTRSNSIMGTGTRKFFDHNLDAYPALTPPFFERLYDIHCGSISQFEHADFLSDFLECCQEVYHKDVTGSNNLPHGYAPNESVQSVMEIPLQSFTIGEGWEKRKNTIRSFTSTFMAKAVALCEHSMKTVQLAGVGNFKRRGDLGNTFVNEAEGYYYYKWQSTSECRKFIQMAKRVWQKLFELQLRSIRMPVTSFFTYRCQIFSVSALIPMLEDAKATPDVLSSTILLHESALLHDALGLPQGALNLRRAADGRCYITALPETLLPFALPTSHLDVNQYARPEAYGRMPPEAQLLATDPRTLTEGDSTGITGPSKKVAPRKDQIEAAKGAVKATILNVLVPEAGAELMKEVSKRSSSFAQCFKDNIVTKVMHGKGVNMRFLYAVLEYLDQLEVQQSGGLTIHAGGMSDDDAEDAVMNGSINVTDFSATPPLGSSAVSPVPTAVGVSKATAMELLQTEMVCRSVKEMVRVEIATSHGESDQQHANRINRLMGTMPNFKRNDVWPVQVHQIIRTKYGAPKSFSMPITKNIVQTLTTYLSNKLGCGFDKTNFRFVAFQAGHMATTIFSPPEELVSAIRQPATPAALLSPKSGTASLNASFGSASGNMDSSANFQRTDSSAAFNPVPGSGGEEPLTRRESTLSAGGKSSSVGGSTSGQEIGSRKQVITHKFNKEWRELLTEFKDRQRLAQKRLLEAQEASNAISEESSGNIVNPEPTVTTYTTVAEELPPPSQDLLDIERGALPWYHRRLLHRLIRILVVERILVLSPSFEKHSAQLRAAMLSGPIANPATLVHEVSKGSVFSPLIVHQAALAVHLVNLEPELTTAQKATYHQHLHIVSRDQQGGNPEDASLIGWLMVQAGKSATESALMMRGVKLVRTALWTDYGLVPSFFEGCISACGLMNVRSNTFDIRDALRMSTRVTDRQNAGPRRAQLVTVCRRVAAALVNARDEGLCQALKVHTKDSFNMHIERFGTKHPQVGVSHAQCVYAFVMSNNSQLTDVQKRELKKFQAFVASMGSSTVDALKTLLLSDGYIATLSQMLIILEAQGEYLIAEKLLSHQNSLTEESEPVAAPMQKALNILQTGAASQVQRLFKAAIGEMKGIDNKVKNLVFQDAAYRKGLEWVAGEELDLIKLHLLESQFMMGRQDLERQESEALEKGGLNDLVRLVTLAHLKREMERALDEADEAIYADQAEEREERRDLYTAFFSEQNQIVLTTHKKRILSMGHLNQRITFAVNHQKSTDSVILAELEGVESIVRIGERLAEEQSQWHVIIRLSQESRARVLIASEEASAFALFVKIRAMLHLEEEEQRKILYDEAQVAEMLHGDIGFLVSVWALDGEENRARGDWDDCHEPEGRQRITIEFNNSVPWVHMAEQTSAMADEEDERVRIHYAWLLLTLDIEYRSEAMRHDRRLRNKIRRNEEREYFCQLAFAHRRRLQEIEKFNWEEMMCRAEEGWVESLTRYRKAVEMDEFFNPPSLKDPFLSNLENEERSRRILVEEEWLRGLKRLQLEVLDEEKRVERRRVKAAERERLQHSKLLQVATKRELAHDTRTNARLAAAVKLTDKELEAHKKGIAHDKVWQGAQQAKDLKQLQAQAKAEAAEAQRQEEQKLLDRAKQERYDDQVRIRTCFLDAKVRDLEMRQLKAEKDEERKRHFVHSSGAKTPNAKRSNFDGDEDEDTLSELRFVRKPLYTSPQVSSTRAAQRRQKEESNRRRFRQLSPMGTKMSSSGGSNPDEPRPFNEKDIVRAVLFLQQKNKEAAQQQKRQDNLVEGVARSVMSNAIHEKIQEDRALEVGQYKQQLEEELVFTREADMAKKAEDKYNRKLHSRLQGALVEKQKQVAAAEVQEARLERMQAQLHGVMEQAGAFRRTRQIRQNREETDLVRKECHDKFVATPNPNLQNEKDLHVQQATEMLLSNLTGIKHSVSTRETIRGESLYYNKDPPTAGDGVDEEDEEEADYEPVGHVNIGIQADVPTAEVRPMTPPSTLAA